VCGGTRDLGWQEFSFPFVTPTGVLALFLGIVHSAGWRLQLPACERCRGRARASSLIVPTSTAAGIAGSIAVVVALPEVGLGMGWMLVLMLLPLLAGYLVGTRLRARRLPRVLRASREELAITIPRRGPLCLVSADAAQVEAVA
jgi:hypothetical protein